MFFILGNGGSGTSLLRGLINAHSGISCLFEHWNKGERAHSEQLHEWIRLGVESESSGFLWGNKIPIEQFYNNKWTKKEMVSFIDHFEIIFLIRRFSKYCKALNKSSMYKKYWNWGREIYWMLREKNPERIIHISFEELILHTEIELYRIANFLNVGYEPTMIKGTNDTGLGRYNQGVINKDKI